jgi:uncharacterized membrane protein
LGASAGSAGHDVDWGTVGNRWDTGRTEAFSDGVFAFAITLLAGALNHTGSELVFVTMYGLNLLAIRTVGFALDAYARRGRLYSPEGEGEELQSEQRELVPVVVAYVVAVLLGLALPSVAVAVYFALALYLVVWPLRDFYRSRSRVHRSSE